LPETVLPLESFSVTVIVDELVPSAATEVELVLTVDLDALTPGGIPVRFITTAIPATVRAIALRPLRVKFGCVTDMSFKVPPSSPDFRD
jgi:hypothetical protein